MPIHCTPLDPSPLDAAISIWHRFVADLNRQSSSLPDPEDEAVRMRSIEAAATRGLVAIGLVAAEAMQRGTARRRSARNWELGLPKLVEPAVLRSLLAGFPRSRPRLQSLQAVLPEVAPSAVPLGRWLREDAGWVELYEGLAVGPRAALDPRASDPALADRLVAEALAQLPAGARGTSLRVLDLACGSGELLLAVARAMQGRGVVLSLEGVDVDPLAVLVARVRLTLAFWGDRDAPCVNVTLADSLLADPVGLMVPVDELGGDPAPCGARPDLILVAPPFDRRPDPVPGAKLRARYPATFTKGSRLTTAFIELALHTVRRGGVVAVYAEQSWCKLDAGRKLVEFLAHRDLRRVIHVASPPATMLVVRAQPPDQGPVLVAYVDAPADMPVDALEIDRAILAQHPWLASGHAIDAVHKASYRTGFDTLDSLASPAGIGSAVNPVPADVYLVPSHVAERHALPGALAIDGQDVRGWGIVGSRRVIVPYERPGTRLAGAVMQRWLWPLEPVLAVRATEKGKPWFDFDTYIEERVQAPRRIVVGHKFMTPQFALDRSGPARMCTSSALQISIAEDVSETRLLSVLAYLNSSVAHALLRASAVPRAASGHTLNSAGIRQLPLMHFPPPMEQRLAALATELTNAAKLRHEGLTDGLATRLGACEAAEQVHDAVHQAAEKDDHLLPAMVWLQEEIDWLVYAAMGLVSRATCPQSEFRALAPEERPFVAARGQAVATPATVDSASWAARLAAVGSQPLEPFEVERCKYDWSMPISATILAEMQVEVCMLERIELAVKICVGAAERACPTAAQVVGDRLAKDRVFRALSSYRRDQGHDVSIEHLLATHSVPALAVERLSPSGRAKRSLWRQMWENPARSLTKPEAKALLYHAKDFGQTKWFESRGPYDLPLGRFSSYPCGAVRLYGWAGWDPGEQENALQCVAPSTLRVDALVELAPWLAYARRLRR